MKNKQTMEIESLVRSNIRKLQPYSCAREEYSGGEAILLDANENPYDTGYNRYPDPYQRQLKAMLSCIKGVEAERMVLGNGSDEIIDLLLRSFCEPGQENVLVFSPGYAMYEVCAAINGVEVRKVLLTPAFLPDWGEMWRQVDDFTKMIFLCTPNNPTGRTIPLDDIDRLCRKFHGLVVVDEAYIDFTREPSAVSLLERYSRLVVIQTLSKAWGMAGLRLGLCFACREITDILNKVKPPYNISSLTQKTAAGLLERTAEFSHYRDAVLAERQRLTGALRAQGIFREVYGSEANFILVIAEECREIYHYLAAQRLVVRLRDIPPLIGGGIRITVGTREENDRLLKALDQWKREKEKSKQEKSL